MTDRARVDVLTELVRDISADETDLPVLSTAPFSDTGRLWLDGERILYTAKTQGNPSYFTGCTRGADQDAGGTEARPHNGGDYVWQDDPTAGALRLSGGTLTGDLIVQGAAGVSVQNTWPRMSWYDPDAAADEKWWIVDGNGGIWNLYAINDDFALINVVMEFDRTGYTAPPPKFGGLAGTGTRVVAADSTGLFSASFLPGELLIAQESDYTGTNVNTAQKIFDESTNGAATVAASTSYLLDAQIHIHTTGTTSHDLRMIFNAGTCTFTSVGFAFWTAITPAATEVSAAASNSWVTTAGETVLTAAVAAASHHTVLLKGVIRINGGGTFIPQYRFSAAPGVAGVTLSGSYLRLTPIGSNTVGTIGAWS